MSLIRDEDRCCYITNILIIVSCLSLFVTIVLLLVLCVCSTALHVIVCPLLSSHHFMVARSVRCKHLRVRALLYEYVPVKRSILSKAARQKQNLQLVDDGTDTATLEDQV